MRGRQIGLWLLGSLLFPLSQVAYGEVKLPAVIGSHMVLQASQENPIWGWAAAGEEVTVTIGSQEKKAKADDQGNWRVRLDPIGPGGPHTMKIAGTNVIELEDILIGEVWVCSGQSNMEWKVKLSRDPDQEIKNADYPNIRLFRIAKRIASQPVTDASGEWKVCTPESIPDFTAVGYFFGRELHKELGVPVGLIQTAWGGTASEAWTTKGALEKNEISKPIIERWDTLISSFSDDVQKYKQALDDWWKTTLTEEEKGAPVSAAPTLPRDPRTNPNRYSGLYNGMIQPLLPYGIRGAIWYQGESNASRAFQYRTIFPMMIEDWRNQWGQGDFPFYFVQLANFRDTFPDPRDSDWAELREAQTMTLALPNTGMAVIVDIGEANDIHPKNKQDVGKRLALNALARIHDKDIPYSGPMYESMKVENGKVHLTFTHTHDGLTTPNGEDLKGFAVAGADRKFVWADARIDGEHVVVSSSEVTEPIAVRYAWDVNPVCNLFNGAGLPASPFRTDEWPGVTVIER